MTPAQVGRRADERGRGPIRPGPFTDPLAAVLPDGAARARSRLRLAGALLFGSGAVTLGSVLFAPDPDLSDHPPLAVCAMVYAVIAAVLRSGAARRAASCTRSARPARSPPPRPSPSPSRSA